MHVWLWSMQRFLQFWCLEKLKLNHAVCRQHLLSSISSVRVCVCALAAPIQNICIVVCVLGCDLLMDLHL